MAACMSTQHPDHSNIHQRVRQAWDHYRTAERTRAEASVVVTEELATARALGVSMYRMAKWLEVTERAIKERLDKYDKDTPLL